MHYTSQEDKSSTEDVADSIGISGFKYVLGTNVSKFRRFVWLFVILLASAWMIWNIHDRVIYFLSRPSAITTEMKYKEKLIFPKVTILYEAIDRYLRVLRDDNGNQTMRQDVIDKYSYILSDKNVTEFYRRVSHKKTTMIQSCTWKGRQCGPENFTEVFTNMGVCYQFAIRPDYMVVDQTNKDGGLTLDLFIEQFDYMRGPQTRAGALVVITDQNETEALAKEQGIGVSVGQYASIGLRQREVTDLPPPHGTCGAAELNNYAPDDPYTYQKCQLNCLTSFIMKKCGCVSVYMPGQDSPKCTLLKNLECVRPNEELFYRNHEITYCNCPSPCKSVIYSQSLSFAEFSDPFKLRLTLSESAVPVADVNRATMIRAWSLFNAISPNITDLFAHMGITLTDYKKTWSDSSSYMSAIVAQVKHLMEFVSVHNMADELMIEIKPDQEANITWYELDYAIHDLNLKMQEVNKSLCVDFWWKDDASDLALVEEILFSSSISKRMSFCDAIAQDIIQNFVQYQDDLFTSFTSAAITKNQNLSVYEWNSPASNLGRLDLLYETFSNQNDAVYTQYETVVDILREIATPPYEKLTSSFYNDNLLKLEIYFKDLGVDESKKSPAYSAEGLVCDIGGSIGLCLGGSILTLIEVFDIIAIICGSRRKQVADLSSSEKKDIG